MAARTWRRGRRRWRRLLRLLEEVLAHELDLALDGEQLGGGLLVLLVRGLEIDADDFEQACLLAELVERRHEHRRRVELTLAELLALGAVDEPVVQRGAWLRAGLEGGGAQLLSAMVAHLPHLPPLLLVVCGGGADRSARGRVGGRVVGDSRRLGTCELGLGARSFGSELAVCQLRRGHRDAHLGAQQLVGHQDLARRCGDSPGGGWRIDLDPAVAAQPRGQHLGRPQRVEIGQIPPHVELHAHALGVRPLREDLQPTQQRRAAELSREGCARLLAALLEGGRRALQRPLEGLPPARRGGERLTRRVEGPAVVIARRAAVDLAAVLEARKHRGREVADGRQALHLLVPSLELLLGPREQLETLAVLRQPVDGLAQRQGHRDLVAVVVANKHRVSDGGGDDRHLQHAEEALRLVKPALERHRERSGQWRPRRGGGHGGGGAADGGARRPRTRRGVGGGGGRGAGGEAGGGSSRLDSADGHREVLVEGLE